MASYKNKHKRANPKDQQSTAGFISFKWLIVLILVISAAGAVLGLGFLKKTGSNPSDENIFTFTARRDDLIITVSEGGSIKARNTIEVKNLVEERQMTILDVVPEGTTITEEDFKNGKVLVTLENSTIKDNLTQREMDFASAEASFAQAKEAYFIQINQNESDIAAAKLGVKWALMDLQKYTGEELAATIVEDVNNEVVLNTSYINSLLEDPNALEGSGAEQRLKELSDSITQTEQNFTLAQERLDGTKKLHEAQYVSDLELRQDELNVTSNELRKERDEISLDLFKRYDFPKQIEKFLSDYMEAKRRLERTHAQARSRLAQQEADRKRAESNFSSRQERLEKTRKDLENCTIKAPAPGLVIYGSGSDDGHRRYRGMGIIGPGETVYNQQTLITLPDLTKLMVDVSVHESSVDKVKPGQRAKIVLDAFPDLTLTGEVLKVAPLPDQSQGWFNPDLKVYKTQVAIDGAHDFVKPGMSAKAEILVNHIKDALVVPNHVVSNRLGNKVCYVSTSRGTQQREVQTGQYNDAFVQILSGLQAGEKVLLSPPQMTEAEAGAANGFEEEIKNGTSEDKKEEEEKIEQSPAGQERQFDPAQMELTDERIDGIMQMISQADAKKAEELKKLRESEPEKFKAELRKLMQEQMKTFRQGEGGGSQQRGGGDATGQRGGGGMGRREGGNNMGRRQDSD